MKAIIRNSYGGPEVLRLAEIDLPVINENEVLIKVHASSVSMADSMMRKGSPYIGRLFLGLFRPSQKIPGTSFSGEVVSCGESVTRFNKGDLVFGGTRVKMSSYAEYLSLDQNEVIHIRPGNMSDEEAAPLSDGALTSISMLRDVAGLKAGQKVLIIGASGGLGTSAVQLGKHYGAEVTGVCSTKNLELVKSLGADYVLDYTTEDFSRQEKKYDLIFDTVAKSSYSECRQVLSPSGMYLTPVMSFSSLYHMIRSARSKGRKVRFSATGMRKAGELNILLNELVSIIEAGAHRTVIDRSYPMEQAAKAHSYVDKGHKTGNVILSMRHRS